MERNRKGQAAMEFLMTYGWAILVVLAAIGALAYFGVLSPPGIYNEEKHTCESWTCSYSGETGSLTVNDMESCGDNVRAFGSVWNATQHVCAEWHDTTICETDVDAPGCTCTEKKLIYDDFTGQFTVNESLYLTTYGTLNPDEVGLKDCLERGVCSPVAGNSTTATHEECVKSVLVE